MIRYGIRSRRFPDYVLRKSFASYDDARRCLEESIPFDDMEIFSYVSADKEDVK